MAGLKKVLREALNTIAPEVDDKTILIIEVPVDPRPNGTDHLTYLALYVNGQWYLTGDSRGPLINKYATTVGLFTAIAKFPAATIQIVTESEPIR